MRDECLFFNLGIFIVIVNFVYYGYFFLFWEFNVFDYDVFV